MGRTPLAGYPYGEVAVDKPDGPNQFAALGQAVERDVILTYATTVDRDVAIPAPRDFQLCRLTVAGQPAKIQCYQAGAWKDMPFGTAPRPDMVPITFLPGWRAWGDGTWGTPSFYKDALGWVRFQGLVEHRDLNYTDIFQLPVGYRPDDGHHYFPAPMPVGPARCSVYQNGIVRAEVTQVPVGNWFFINHVIFYAGV